MGLYLKEQLQREIQSLYHEVEELDTSRRLHREKRRVFSHSSSFDSEGRDAQHKRYYVHSPMHALKSSVAAMVHRFVPLVGVAASVMKRLTERISGTFRNVVSFM
jgi:hypothetical protein